MQDKVSIITPSWNSEKYIEKTIESVQKQTYMNWEMIVVDDCSTDRTVEIVEKISEEDPRVTPIYLNALNAFFRYSFSLDAISEKLETARPLQDAAYDISVLDSHPIKKYGLGIPLLLKFHTASLPLIRMSYFPFIFFITIS